LNNVITTSELTKFYGTHRAVDDLTLEVSEGELFGFLGPNGAGKTTTMLMLCGLLPPSAGSARVAGYSVVKDSLEVRRIVGLLPESLGFYNWMNAEEYLLYFASLYKINKREAKQRRQELLERVGLSKNSHKPIGHYSRGMKQRLALAKALINEPRILFLDEPTAGLDPQGQQDVQRILTELHEVGVTVFLSSHALSEVSSLCDRMAIVNHGRLVAQGSIEALRSLAGDSRGMLVRVLNLDGTRERLRQLPFEAYLKTEKDFIDVTISENPDSASQVIEVFEKNGLQIYEVRRLRLSLDQVFFNLTRDQSSSRIER
jgi:ABC-2 type transport system ATP-binding protein